MAGQRINKDLALEMTMQEVLGNIEELALDFGYSDSDDCFEILAIEPCPLPDVETDTSRDSRIRTPFDAVTLIPRVRVA